MKRFWSERWSRSLIGVFALTVPFVLFAIEGFRYYRAHLSREGQIYHVMSAECHPIWKELAEGRVAAGQPVEDLIVRTPPSRIERHGPYVTLIYFKGDLDGGIPFSGLSVVAKDNRLVQAEAWSCTWTHTFFDQMSEDERGDYSRSYRAFLNEKLKRRAEEAEGDER